MVEDLPSREVPHLIEKAASILQSGSMSVEGEEVRYGVTIGTAHFPDEAGNLEELWQIALNRLEA